MELTNLNMITWCVADVILFPSVCCLWDWRARGDHVQQVLPLAGVDGGWRLVTRQAGVHVGHGDSCEHAADEQVRVWNKLQAIAILLSNGEFRKKDVMIWKHLSLPLLKFPKQWDSRRGGKTMDHRGETKGKNMNHQQRNYRINGTYWEKSLFHTCILVNIRKTHYWVLFNVARLDDWTNVGWIKLAKTGCFAG